MGRVAVAIAAGLCHLALLGPAPAHAQQGPSLPQVYRDHETGLLVYFAELPGRAPGRVTIGYVSPIYWFLNPLEPLQPGFGCRFIQPASSNFAACDPPVNGYLVLLGPGPNDVRVLPTVPELPGPNRIEVNNGKDKVEGGQSGERINGGKGNDRIDPGPGKDDVNAGPGNDTVDSRDGERDKVNGGKGRHDVAEVDNKDKVRNVEVVKRK